MLSTTACFLTESASQADHIVGSLVHARRARPILVRTNTNNDRKTDILVKYRLLILIFHCIGQIFTFNDTDIITNNINNLGTRWSEAKPGALFILCFVLALLLARPIFIV